VRAGATVVGTARGAAVVEDRRVLHPTRLEEWFAERGALVTVESSVSG
jgi:hypothetical protein